jgi:uroporphyrinogen decarboxylase
MSELRNDRFLRALLRQPVDRTPIWMMRQAGRYLPEYRATRERAGSFLDLCKNAELACEVTLQPLRRYPMDAAILFSDILTVPDALGLGLYFEEGEGPRFRKTVRSEADLSGLNTIRAEDDLGYVMRAVSTIRRELNNAVPLIGFSGSPWTLATYMVEGGSSKDFAQIKTMAYDQPQLMHQLLSLLADAVADYLAAQVRAGAQALQIFDTWGGSLSAAGYREFSLEYMQRVIARLPIEADGRKVPVIVFTKGGGQWLNDIANCGAQAVGLDWTTDINLARQQIGDRVALQGNMDPSMLFASPERIRSEVAAILAFLGALSDPVVGRGRLGVRDASGGSIYWKFDGSSLLRCARVR